MVKNSMTITPDLLMSRICQQPEPVLREIWNYVRFLEMKRQEDENSDILVGRDIEQEILDILEGDAPATR
jgi:hypothetical protein